MDLKELVSDAWHLDNIIKISDLNRSETAIISKIKTKKECFILKITANNFFKETNIHSLKKSPFILYPIKTSAQRNFHRIDNNVYELYHYLNHPDLLSNPKYATQLAEFISNLNEMNKHQTKLIDILSIMFISQLKKRSRQNNIEADIHFVLDYLNNSFVKYKDYLEQGLVHGDLHPKNIYINKDDDLIIGDWEHTRTGEQLYDLAFLLGCITVGNTEYLKSDWIKQLLSVVSSKLSLSELTIDTFLDLIIVTRLHWLLLWMEEEDNEMIIQDISYIKYLIQNHEKIYLDLAPYLKRSSPNNTDKLIIADAIFSKTIQEYDKVFSKIPNIAASELLINNKTPEIVSTEMREYIISLSKHNNIKRILSILNIQYELLHLSEYSDINLSELAYSFVNASIEFLKHNECTAIKTLLKGLKDLNKIHPIPEYIICKTYLLRNLSVLYGNIGNKLEFLKVLKHVNEIYMTHKNIPAICEEYGRVLSNACVTELKTKNTKEALVIFNDLKKLHTTHPESNKIKSAYIVALKNFDKIKF